MASVSFSSGANDCDASDIVCSAEQNADTPIHVEDVQVQDGLRRGLPIFEDNFNNTWRLENARRLVTGGMALREECGAVMDMVGDMARLGRQCISTHSVYGQQSPYTPLESVVSVRAVQVARLASENSTFVPALNVMLGLTARARTLIMEHFNETRLYFHLTEMVCREPRQWSSDDACIEEGCLPFCMRACPHECLAANPDLSLDICTEVCRDDCGSTCELVCTDSEWLSHPIHADANPADCDMLDNGLCMRRLPQDYTSHIYLNENFDGGEFFFTPDLEGSERKPVQPTCGRMLAYSSGYENLHGVTGLKRGRRCLVTMWFTHEESKIEELPLPDGSLFLEGRRQGPGRGFA